MKLATEDQLSNGTIVRNKGLLRVCFSVSPYSKCSQSAAYTCGYSVANGYYIVLFDDLNYFASAQNIIPLL